MGGGISVRGDPVPGRPRYPWLARGVGRAKRPLGRVLTWPMMTWLGHAARCAAREAATESAPGAAAAAGGRVARDAPAAQRFAAGHERRRRHLSPAVGRVDSSSRARSSGCCTRHLRRARVRCMVSGAASKVRARTAAPKPRSPAPRGVDSRDFVSSTRGCALAHSCKTPGWARADGCSFDCSQSRERSTCRSGRGRRNPPRPPSNGQHREAHASAPREIFGVSSDWTARAPSRARGPLHARARRGRPSCRAHRRACRRLAGIVARPLPADLRPPPGEPPGAQTHLHPRRCVPSRAQIELGFVPTHRDGRGGQPWTLSSQTPSDFPNSISHPPPENRDLRTPVLGSRLQEGGVSRSVPPLRTRERARAARRAAGGQGRPRWAAAKSPFWRFRAEREVV